MSVELLWQRVMSAHLKWCLEIEASLGVKVENSNPPHGHVFSHGRIIGARAEEAREQMQQLEAHLVALHASLTILRGDPLRRGFNFSAPAALRGRTHEAMDRLASLLAPADLRGRTPWQALIESGLDHIDVVLIGPDNRAAEMLAAEPRLYAAAKWRVDDTHDLDNFTPHVRDLLARADSILAALAISRIYPK